MVKCCDCGVNEVVLDGEWCDACERKRYPKSYAFADGDEDDYGDQGGVPNVVVEGVRRFG